MLLWSVCAFTFENLGIVHICAPGNKSLKARAIHTHVDVVKDPVVLANEVVKAYVATTASTPPAAGLKETTAVEPVPPPVESATMF